MRVCVFVCYLNVDESNGASLSLVFFGERSEKERETMQKLWGVVACSWPESARRREEASIPFFLFSLEFDKNCPSLPQSFFLGFFLLLLLSEFCVCFRWKGKGGIVGGASVGYVPKGRKSGGMGAVCGWARELNLHSGGPPVAVLFPAEAEQQEQI